MNELSGGIKNALERGGNLEEIRGSFINAGYAREQVDQAIKELFPSQIPQQTQPPQNSQLVIPQVPQPKSQQKQIIQSKPPQQIEEIQPLQNPAAQNPPTIPPKITETEKFQPLPITPIQKKKSYLLPIILIVVCLLILVGAGLAGLYWSNIAKFFNL